MGKAFSAAIKLTILDHYDTRFSTHEKLKREASSSRVKQLFRTTTPTAINSLINIEVADDKSPPRNHVPRHEHALPS